MSSVVIRLTCATADEASECKQEGMNANDSSEYASDSNDNHENIEVCFVSKNELKRQGQGAPLTCSSSKAS